MGDHFEIPQKVVVDPRYVPDVMKGTQLGGAISDTFDEALVPVCLCSNAATESSAKCL